MELCSPPINVCVYIRIICLFSQKIKKKKLYVCWYLVGNSISNVCCFLFNYCELWPYYDMLFFFFFLFRMLIICFNITDYVIGKLGFSYSYTIKRLPSSRTGRPNFDLDIFSSILIHIYIYIWSNSSRILYSSYIYMFAAEVLISCLYFRVFFFLE